MPFTQIGSLSFFGVKKPHGCNETGQVLSIILSWIYDDSKEPIGVWIHSKSLKEEFSASHLPTGPPSVILWNELFTGTWQSMLSWYGFDNYSLGSCLVPAQKRYCLYRWRTPCKSCVFTIVEAGMSRSLWYHQCPLRRNNNIRTNVALF